VFSETIPAVLRQANVRAEDVVGAGVDFTACTVLPALRDGTPLCFLPELASNPHAYVKLWKHHAAQAQATHINAVAKQRGEGWLARYGGKLSSEWVLAKALQILEEAPDIYEKMERFIEAADWVVMQLCGAERRSACTAGYKAGWSKREGYASSEFLKAVHPEFEHFVDEKLSRDIYPIGAKAGEITEKAAKLTGLLPGTAVAVGNVDAHVALPPVGIVSEAKMLMIMGTSTCHILLGGEEKNVPGMCGVVEDGVVPGYFGYEAGQSCVGDHFAWFIENCLPARYERAAKEAGVSNHKYLREKAKALKPGESGLVALDWWNGNRSVLVDVDLTGMIVGMTLLTRPEEIYRALIEATAYGTRMIIDTFEQSGVPIRELYAAGGIAEKDEMMMQIYADVTNREIRISGSPQAPALGAAMFGAVAAGKAKGGFDTIQDAAAVMARVKDTVYRPIPDNVAVYNELFDEYRQLHDYFGRGGNDAMKRLKALKKRASKE
jgi:L-ribulokinase